MLKYIKNINIIKSKNIFYKLINNMSTVTNISEKPNYPKIEEEVLKHWDDIDAFKTQLKKTEHFPKYSFYDGPPFATGLPHYGHICAGTIKDVVTRYASMNGRYVERRFGWDCHGLPVEFEIDQLLNIKTKEDANKIGVEKYNEECRKIVMRYSGEWEKTVKRFGRWIDFENDYKTMSKDFMESVWYIFQQIFKKGLVYRGCKIMPYSNGCTTVLSNFEAGLNYKDVIDPTLYVLFPLKDDPEVNFIAWTTTPWTLPSNLALCVNPEFDYVKIKDLATGKVIIMAECRLCELYNVEKKDSNATEKKSKPKKQDKMEKVENNKPKEEPKQQFEIIERIKGKDLKGVKYIPLFDYYMENEKLGCFQILADNFVTSDAGTGIVHCAPAYGEDDYRVCTQNNIIKPDEPGVAVDESGLFTDRAPDYKGIYLKDADKLISRDLKEKGRVFKISQYKHSYPYCWRSDQPLIYKAVNAWFIKVTDIKEDLIKNNKKAYWVPKSIQEKRFNNWLENACDWCFSRNRFWGNPIPIWASDDMEEVVCIGSVKELEELSGVKVEDLHREHIDKITIDSKMGKGKLRRIEEVFDCWFESGSMPFASYGYPKKISEEDFNKIFPADFIGEGIDQTRGWFYTLNVIATCLRNTNPYQNLIVNGLVLASDGEKMSKRKKNYPDPTAMVDKYGADSIRLYLMNSPLVKAENLKFQEKGLLDICKNVFNPWYNVFRFLMQNIDRWNMVNADKFVFDEEKFSNKFSNPLDEYLLAANHKLIKFLKNEFSYYRLYTVLEKKIKFLEVLTNWYVRLNRLRLKGDYGKEEWADSLNILFGVMLNCSMIMAPYIPFITEYFYSNLRQFTKEGSIYKEKSIHFLQMPTYNDNLIDEKLLQTVELLQSIINCGRNIREQKKINLKQPLKTILIVHKDEEFIKDIKNFETYIKEELNVTEIEYSTDYKMYMNYQLIPNHQLLGSIYLSEYNTIRPKLMKLTSDDAELFIKNKKITVDGKEFDENCFTLKANFIDQKDENKVITGQIDFSVVLNIEIDENLKKVGLSREFINRVQKLRKEKNLNLTDRIVILYQFSDNNSLLKAAINDNIELIKNTVKKSIFEFSESNTKLNVIASEDFEIESEKFNVKIVAPYVEINKEKIMADFGVNSDDLLLTYVSTLNPVHLEDKDYLEIVYNSSNIKLLKNEHFSVKL